IESVVDGSQSPLMRHFGPRSPVLQGRFYGPQNSPAPSSRPPGVRQEQSEFRRLRTRRGEGANGAKKYGREIRRRTEGAWLLPVQVMIPKWASVWYNKNYWG